MLFRLVAHSPESVEHTVISMLDDGAYGEAIRRTGSVVLSLNMRTDRLRLKDIVRLHRAMQSAKPDLIQTWMYHANLLGGLAARIMRQVPVVWGIHNCSLEPQYSSFSARLANSLCALLSGFLPTRIACCGERAAWVHQNRGYRKERPAIVSNGIDVERFRRDESARVSLRQQWRLAQGYCLIGCVARWHPLKDHANLLEALSLLTKTDPRFRCVLVGTQMESSNEELVRLIAQFDLGERVILAGPRDDIPAVMSALDVHVLPSIDEAFPNVVLEAMACGTPCVVTDVGDAQKMVGETGWIAPPRNPDRLRECLTSALQALAAGDRHALSERVRQRVVERFSIGKMVNEYVQLWETVVRESRR